MLVLVYAPATRAASPICPMLLDAWNLFRMLQMCPCPTLAILDMKSTAYPIVMRILEILAMAFFRTFGITEPSDRKLRSAVWFLLAMFTAIILCFIIGAAILFHTA